MGRSGREWPRPPHPPDRPPGHPPVAAFDPHSYQPSRIPSLPAPTLSLRATVWAPIMSPGVGRHIYGCGDRQYTIHTCGREHSTRQTRRNDAATCRSSTWPCHPWEVGRSRYGDNWSPDHFPTATDGMHVCLHTYRPHVHTPYDMYYHGDNSGLTQLQQQQLQHEQHPKHQHHYLCLL